MISGFTDSNRNRIRQRHLRSASGLRTAVAVVATLLIAASLRAASTGKTEEHFRVNTTTGRRIDFDRITFDSESFIGHTFQGYQVRLPRSQISRIRIQTGTHAAGGFVLGAIFGLAFGASLDYAISSDASLDSPELEAPLVAFLIGWVGWLGSTVGMKSPRWETIDFSDPRLNDPSLSLNVHF